MKPITSELASAIPQGRTGVLLKSRDFIDGTFAGVTSGKVKIESLLFGSRTFDLAREVLVIVLRGSVPQPWRCSITGRDGTVLYGQALAISADRAWILEAPDSFLPTEEVIELSRREP